jgi:CubicO group peptidase (beta-lactamase class C family)
MEQKPKNFQHKLTDLLEKGVMEGVYPGAVLLVAQNGQISFLKEVGNLSIIPLILPMKRNTIFDLASLTKPLATTVAVMRLVNDNRINLDQPLSDLIDTNSLRDKKVLTLRAILSHCAGFKDWVPFYPDLMKYRADIRKKVLRKKIIELPLQYAQGSETLYSDLGFMILEWVVEAVSHETLRDFVHKKFYGPMGLKRTFLSTGDLTFNMDEYAATEDCSWRNRIIQGEVHDENAYAAGGYSGHAGLFGTAKEIFVIADILRKHYTGETRDYFSPDVVREFFKRQEMVRGSTWALGWDTPSSENSSAGKYISPHSVGHLGFSGTSLWMDLDRNILVIFLSNRIHPIRNNLKIKAFRPVLHDLIFTEMTDAHDIADYQASTIKL